MKNSKIEWTSHTVNLWWGCSKVTTGCKFCYAETLSNRFGDDIWGEHNGRKRIKSAFNDLDKYQRAAKSEGRKDRVFVGSMMDVFEESKPLLNPIGGIKTTDDLRQMLFQMISEGKYDNLIFLFLTKRPENIARYAPTHWMLKGSAKNVWYGTSISDQKTADEWTKRLQEYGGNNNLFISCEPQIGEIKSIDLSGIDWLIQGGESGHGKRPFDIKWAYKMKEICAEQNIPYFFKQIDKVKPIPDDLLIRELPIF